MLPGLTVVVSPLIALIQDQVQQLQGLGIPAADAKHNLHQVISCVKLLYVYFFENSFPLSHSKHLRIKHRYVTFMRRSPTVHISYVVWTSCTLPVVSLCLLWTKHIVSHNGDTTFDRLRQVIHFERAISEGSHDGTHCNCNKTCSSGCTSSSGYSSSAHCEDFIQSSRTDVLGSKEIKQDDR